MKFPADRDLGESALRCKSKGTFKGGMDKAEMRSFSISGAHGELGKSKQASPVPPPPVQDVPNKAALGGDCNNIIGKLTGHIPR